MSDSGPVHLLRGQLVDPAQSNRVAWLHWCNRKLDPTIITQWAVDPIAADCSECLAAYNAAMVSMQGRAAINAGITSTRVQLNRTFPEGVAPGSARVTYVEGPRPGAPLGSPINLPVPERSLEVELRSLLNRYSAENGSNTPDHVLTDFLMMSLRSFDLAVRERTRWKTSGEPNRPSMEKPITGW